LIDTIPLSWLRSDITHPRFKSVRLPLSGLTWIHSASIPLELSFEEVYAYLVDRFGDGILIRGCRAEIAEFLLSKGFGAVRTGAEAMIDLGNRTKTPSSARESSRRGRRWGRVEEVPFTEACAERVSRFRSVSAHGGKPQLRYLYHAGFDPLTRCFAFRAPGDAWLGAVTISMSSESSAHTEMILRDRNSPTGVMEALFAGIMNKLKGEGLRLFSLGEVPFVSRAGAGTVHLTNGSRIIEKLLFSTGRVLRYAYDFEGLYKFKDKFRPDWEPVYVCAPKVSWSALADMFVESRFYALSRSELMAAIKGYSPRFLKHS